MIRMVLRCEPNSNEILAQVQSAPSVDKVFVGIEYRIWIRLIGLVLRNESIPLKEIILVFWPSKNPLRRIDAKFYEWIWNIWQNNNNSIQFTFRTDNEMEFS